MWRSLLVQGDEGRGGSRRVCCSLQRGARPQACLYRARTGEERSQTQPGATAQTARIIWVLGSVADTEDPQPRKIHATVLAIRRPSEGDRRGAECCSVASCTLRQKQWSGRGAGAGSNPCWTRRHVTNLADASTRACMYPCVSSLLS